MKVKKSLNEVTYNYGNGNYLNKNDNNFKYGPTDEINVYQQPGSNKQLDSIERAQVKYSDAIKKKDIPLAAAAVEAGVNFATGTRGTGNTQIGTKLRTAFGDEFMVRFIEAFKWQELKSNENEFNKALRELYVKYKYNGMNLKEFQALYNMYLKDGLDWLLNPTEQLNSKSIKDKLSDKNWIGDKSSELLKMMQNSSNNEFWTAVNKLLNSMDSKEKQAFFNNFKALAPTLVR